PQEIGTFVSPGPFLPPEDTVVPLAKTGKFNCLIATISRITPSTTRPPNPIVCIMPTTKSPAMARYVSPLASTTMISPGCASLIARRTAKLSPTAVFTVKARPAILYSSFKGFTAGLMLFNPFSTSEMAVVGTALNCSITESKALTPFYQNYKSIIWQMKGGDNGFVIIQTNFPAYLCNMSKTWLTSLSPRPDKLTMMTSSLSSSFANFMA